MGKVKYSIGFIFFLILIFVLYKGIINVSKYKSKDDILSKSQVSNVSEYEQKVNDFIKVEVDDINELQQKNTYFYLYTGRGTCPHCVLFVDKLYKATKQIDIEIYYLDSEDTDFNFKLKMFRDKYSIKTVPDLKLLKGELEIDTLNINDDIEVSEISNFLQKNIDTK